MSPFASRQSQSVITPFCDSQNCIASHSLRASVESGSWNQLFAMTKQVQVCCSSPAAICYWFMVSLLAWGALSLIGRYWRPLHASAASACLFAMAIGCIANWFKNRSLHCTITGPLFLIGGILFLLSGAHMIPRRDTLWVWPVLFIGIGLALLLEWMYGRRSAP